MSELALAMEVFGFFKELAQRNDLLVVFESKLRHAFERFALVDCTLPEVLQVMFQVRGSRVTVRTSNPRNEFSAPRWSPEMILLLLKSS